MSKSFFLVFLFYTVVSVLCYYMLNELETVGLMVVGVTFRCVFQIDRFNYLYFYPRCVDQVIVLTELLLSSMILLIL